MEIFNQNKIKKQSDAIYLNSTELINEVNGIYKYSAF